MKRNIIGFLVLLTLSAGCSSSDITSPNDVVFPAHDISFSRHVLPLFTVSCNFSGCHDQNASTNLTTWSGVRSLNVVNQAGDTSCGLIRVIYYRQFHNGPLNINSNHQEGLRQWVLEGAQNN